MSKEEPFILSKRKNSPYYQVRFKNPDKTSPVRFFSAKSTKETVRSKALAKAWAMYNEEKISTKSFVQSARNSDISGEDLQTLVKILQDRGLVTSVVLPNQKASEPLCKFLLDFWTIDVSPYIAEKKRMNRHIGLQYIQECKSSIERFWCKFFSEDKLLAEVTRKDLKDFINYMETVNLGWSKKLKIYRAGSVALKWAFNDERLDRDVTAGIVSFSGTSKSRSILTMEMAELIFSMDWKDERCKLANIIAMLTGMRAGEIAALRKEDLGRDCIYVRHSWNCKEGLKTPKNGETRVVYFPFPKIIEKMLQMADMTGGKLDSFIFFAPLKAGQPMDDKIFNLNLKHQLRQAGIDEEFCKDVCFHSWRHFYTTYMGDKVNQRVLQSQTGHKTITMLEHYGNHEIDSDVIAIENAQKEIFGNIVENCKF